MMKIFELLKKCWMFRLLMIPQSITHSHWLSHKMHVIYNELKLYGSWDSRDWSFHIQGRDKQERRR